MWAVGHVQLVYTNTHFTRTVAGENNQMLFQVSGEWKGPKAGGCKNHPLTFKYNPRFRLEIDSCSSNNHLLIELKGPKQYQIGLDVTISNVSDETVTAPFKTTSSGPYRCVSQFIDLILVVLLSLQLLW